MKGSPNKPVITEAQHLCCFSGLQEVCILLAFTAPLMGVSVSQRLGPQRYGNSLREIFLLVGRNLKVLNRFWF